MSLPRVQVPFFLRRTLARPTRFAGLLLAFLLVSLLAAAATVTLFSVTLDGSNVRVEWELNSETDVTGFDLYRKSASDPSYSLLTNVLPTGQRRYFYTDQNVYRGASGGPFTYRLTVRTTTGDQSYTANLAQTPSSVQRSWGTIKSMFR